MYLDENIIFATCFVIFLYFSYKPIRKSITSILDSRINEIKQKVEEAKTFKEDAEKLLNKAEQKFSLLEDHKKSLLSKAEKMLHEQLRERNKEIESILQKKEQSAIEAIERKKSQAVSKLEKEFTDSVLDIVQKYLKETNNNDVSDTKIAKHLIDI